MGIFTTNNNEEEICLTLKPVMDLALAEKLRLSLLDCLAASLAANKTIKIMAGKVDRITTPCLQILLAMKIRTDQQHIDFLFPEMSDAFRTVADDIGLQDQFTALEQTL